MILSWLFRFLAFFGLLSAYYTLFLVRLRITDVIGEKQNAQHNNVVVFVTGYRNLLPNFTY